MGTVCYYCLITVKENPHHPNTKNPRHATTDNGRRHDPPCTATRAPPVWAPIWGVHGAWLGDDMRTGVPKSREIGVGIARQASDSYINAIAIVMVLRSTEGSKKYQDGKRILDLITGWSRAPVSLFLKVGPRFLRAQRDSFSKIQPGWMKAISWRLAFWHFAISHFLTAVRCREPVTKRHRKAYLRIVICETLTVLRDVMYGR